MSDLGDLKTELAELAILALDGELDDVQRERLATLIAQDADAARAYCDVIGTHVALMWQSGEAHPSLTLPALLSSPAETDSAAASAHALQLLSELEPERIIPIDLTEELKQRRADRRRASHGASRAGSRASGHSPRVIIIPRFLAYAGAAIWVLFAAWLAWELLEPSAGTDGSAEPGEPIAKASDADDPSDDPSPSDDELVDPDTRPIVAKLLRTHSAAWSGDGISENGALSAGTMFLTAGYIELELNSKARVMVQAPAEFTLVQGNAVQLHSGKLVADIPESAHGFAVHTPTARVVDFGTRFGVDVSPQRLTTAAVFEGEVELSSNNAEAGLRLIEDQFARTDARGFVDERPRQIEGQERFRFVREWAHAERGWQADGAIRLPDNERVSLFPGDLESNESIFLIPERHGHRLPYRVIATLPTGDLTTDTASLNIPAGTAVDAYTVHFDAVGDSVRAPVEVGAVVHFDRPILGVILDKDIYLATSPGLGNPRVIYPKTTDLMGLETRDRIAVSPDRHTLTLDLHSTDSSDQIRVLVAAEDTE